MSNSPYIQEITEAEFESGVIAASYQQPVLVDFWADWCQPCRSLMPILAQLADAYQGQFLLAKVNTEENQALASQLGIRSLPTVRLYIEGQAVDEFMGALPEPQIRAFLDKHLPNEMDIMSEQALMLAEQGDLESALDLVDRALALDSTHVRAKVTKAQISHALGDRESALDLLNGLDELTRKDPQVAALLADLNLTQRLENAPDADQLRDRLANNPKDSEAHFQLALHAINAHNYEEALELLLNLMRIDRHFQDDAARKTMLEVFDLMGGEGPVVSRYRSKLFTLMH
jgi:putative thioredoxin